MYITSFCGLFPDEVITKLCKEGLWDKNMVDWKTNRIMEKVLTLHIKPFAYQAIDNILLLSF